MDVFYSLYIKYKQKQLIIGNVDPDQYSYVKLFNDIDNYIMVDILSGVSCTYVAWCLVLSTMRYIPIRTDKDVLNMFVMYSGLIDIYLGVCNVKTVVAIA